MNLTNNLPNLGLVCITNSNRVRYRTVTRKRLLQHSDAEQHELLKQLYIDNLQRLDGAIIFCLEHNIRLYRIPSGLFPFADTPIGESLLAELSEQLKKTGDCAMNAGVRIVVHPDQFVVLSSDSPSVIENSIKILKAQALVLDKLGLPRSPWAIMEIHGGKSDRSERLVNIIRSLPEAIRSRLALENDEYAYSANEILDVCHAASVPMVFDAHHHVIHEHLTSYEDPSVPQILEAASETWPVKEWQLVHISNGRQEFADPQHSDLITVMPSSYSKVPWIEVEAKHKELAIQKLQQEWLLSISTSAFSISANLAQVGKS